MTHILAVSDLDLDDTLRDGKTPLLLMVTATWCAPCKVMTPLLERLAANSVGRLRVAKLDLDASPLWGNKLHVRGAPTFVLFRNGSPVSRHLGAMNAEKLEAFAAGPT